MRLKRVRYLYVWAQLSSAGKANSSGSSQQPILSSEELSQALAQMPIDWLEQLHHAATKVNSKQVQKLLTQMPKVDVPLANALSELVNNFCFEEIVTLTKSEISPE